MNMKRRAVIVRGVRTPFVKAFGQLMKVDTIGLGVAAVGALLEKTGISRKEIEGIVWGGVILPGGAPNVGREIALDLQLPPSVEAMTVTRACASGLQAIASGRFDDEVAPIGLPGGGRVHADNLVRADTSVEKLAKLRPVFFDDGTV